MKAYFLPLLLVLGLAASCDLGLSDNHYIKTPYEGEGISANSVTVYVELPVDLFLNSGVDRVEFFINSNWAHTVQAPGPYQYEWDTSMLTNGRYTISITVYPELPDESPINDSIYVLIQK